MYAPPPRHAYCLDHTQRSSFPDGVPLLLSPHCRPRLFPERGCTRVSRAAQVITALTCFRVIPYRVICQVSKYYDVQLSLIAPRSSFAYSPSQMPSQSGRSFWFFVC